MVTVKRMRDEDRAQTCRLDNTKCRCITRLLVFVTGCWLLCLI